MISEALAVLETEEQRNELAEFYEIYKNRFYSIAYEHLHNRQDSEDAIQEAFLSIAKNPNALFKILPEKRISYLSVIVRNSAYKIWNRKHKIEETQTELTYDFICDTASPEEQITSELSCEEIYSFIETLPEASKTAVYLKLSFDMKYSDIAKELGISEEAARKRVTRAIHQIRKFMEGKDE